MVAYFILCCSESLSEPCKRWFLATIHQNSSKWLIGSSTRGNHIRVLRNSIPLVRIYVSHTIVTVGSSLLAPRTSWMTRGRVYLTLLIVIEEWIQINRVYQERPPPALKAESSARRRPCPIWRAPRRRRRKKILAYFSPPAMRMWAQQS